MSADVTWMVCQQTRCSVNADHRLSGGVCPGGAGAFSARRPSGYSRGPAVRRRGRSSPWADLGSRGKLAEMLAPPSSSTEATS